MVLWCKISPVPFTAIGVDQAQEHQNKVDKGAGGIAGITTHPESLLRYCLSSPVLAIVSQQIEQILNVECPSQMHHQDLNNQKVQRQEANIKKLKEVLSKNDMFNTVENEDGT